MRPISGFMAAAQDNLEKGTLIYTKNLKEYAVEVIFDEYSLWLVLYWKNGERIAFRAAYGGGGSLTLGNTIKKPGETIFSMEGTLGQINVSLTFPDSEKALLRYTTVLVPSFNVTIPYWPRDIVPLFKNEGKTQNTKGTVHAHQVGTRSGLLFFTQEYPQTGSVFYFQNLTALNKYCEDTHTSAGDIVGGQWPEIGMKLPVSNDNPLIKGQKYTISDAFVLADDIIIKDHYQMSQLFLTYLAEIYIHLPKPETQHHDWPDILHRGLKDLKEHKGCWKFAEGRSYLNAYVSDYKTPPESMVQLAVLLPLIDFDKWSGEDHSDIADILHSGLENFYDKNLGTIVRWLPALEKNLDWSEEQKQPEVMDSWYLHHPLLNLSRLALSGDKLAEKLVLDSVEYVINVAHHFDYQWPVFYKMATLEVLKEETEKGKGGEKDVPGAYAHLMIQVWQLTGDKRYYNEAVKAAKKLAGLSFDIMYEANNTAFSAGALLRLYKETGDKLYLDLSYLCIASIIKNVQLWECDYGYAKYYPTFFAVYPLKDAPYTAAYEEQEVFAGIHSFLNEADGLEEILPSVKLLLAESIRYIINRVVYYYPPMLNKKIIAERDDIRMGEIDTSLWISLEDIRDGWEKSGQVGQEVYGAGIAFGIVPRQYYKVEAAGFMVFTDYPAASHHVKKTELTFFIRGDKRLACRMVIMPLNIDKPDLNLTVISDNDGIVKPVKEKHNYLEYSISGNNRVHVKW